MKAYGKELIADLHDCDPKFFTKVAFEIFLKELCGLIDMEREDLHFWDYEAYMEAPDHLQGISLVQFIKTSNITIHSPDKLRKYEYSDKSSPTQCPNCGHLCVKWLNFKECIKSNKKKEEKLCQTIS